MPTCLRVFPLFQRRYWHRKIESIKIVESFFILCGELHMRILEYIETLSLRSAIFFIFK